MNTSTLLLHATATTLLITLSALALGLIGSYLLCLIFNIKHPVTCFLTLSFIHTIRRTPIILQIFFIYYGLAQIQYIQHTWIWWIIKNPLPTAIVTLGINSSAYMGYLLIKLIEKTPEAYTQSAKNLGLSPLQVIIHIKLPYAFFQLKPFYKNEAITLMKASSLASVIACTELTSAVNQIASEDYHMVIWLAVSCVIYWIIGNILSRLAPKILNLLA